MIFHFTKIIQNLTIEPHVIITSQNSTCDLLELLKTCTTKHKTWFYIVTYFIFKTGLKIFIFFKFKLLKIGYIMRLCNFSECRESVYACPSRKHATLLLGDLPNIYHHYRRCHLHHVCVGQQRCQHSVNHL